MRHASQAAKRTDGRAFGRAVPAAMIGELTDSTALLATPDRLSSRLAEDGYLLLRGVLDVGEVMAARRAVFTRLASIDELRVGRVVDREIAACRLCARRHCEEPNSESKCF